MDNVVAGEGGFLKIDCEGCEGLIFLFAPKGYLRRIEKIVVEFQMARRRSSMTIKISGGGRF